MKDYYLVFDIAVDASQEVIKEQYKFLVQAWHPDKFANPAQKLKAEEKIKEINAVYEILRDPTKRAEYDNHFRSASRRREQEYHAGTNRQNSENEWRTKEQSEFRKKQEEEIRRIQETRRKQRQARENHLCGSCGAFINLDEYFCGNCGDALIQKCKKCDGLIYQGDFHCGTCGAILI